ncbi:MAG: YqgE/AlgH family protein [Phycisphaeraceae bacterium]|nr:YqgE/AlgH family protein [Phycisphaeraceae bacterium]
MSDRVGQLLVATPELADPNFARTVTLIISSDEEGVVGLTLNRPTEMTLEQAWEESAMGPVCERGGRLFAGGPCPGPLMALHRESEYADGEVLDGLYFSSDPDALIGLLSRDDPRPLRCYVGYAGWDRHQLAAEIETSSWLLARTSAEEVLADEPVDWLEVLERIEPSLARLHRHPALVPDDPSCN